MKKLLLLLLLPIGLYAQEDKQINQSQASQQVNYKIQTKYSALVSKSNFYLKYVDTKFQNIQPVNARTIYTLIRKVIEPRAAYFFALMRSETTPYCLDPGSEIIEYSDLVTINKAIEKLISESVRDLEKKPDFLENKYVSEDGFTFGYRIKRDLLNFYIGSERYGNWVIINDYKKLAAIFKEAQTKIEELKKNE